MNKGMIFSHEMKFFIEKFGRYQLKTVSLHRFPRKVLMIGLWCNGSTTGFGSVCPGSNPGSPTQKSPAIRCGAFLCISYNIPVRIASMTLAGARSANHSFFMKSI